MPTAIRPREYLPNIRHDFYNPHRDIAVLGFSLLPAAVACCQPQHHEPWFAEFMRAHNLTDQAVIEGFAVMAEALKHVIPLPTPTEGVKAVGFDQLPAPVQVACYTRLGQLFLAVCWAGIKDKSQPKSAPPLEIKDLVGQIDAMLLANRQEKCPCPGSANSTNCTASPTATSAST